MKIKKYKAKTMADAMKQIKSELGADAIILSNKEIKTARFLGLFKQKAVEVVAALDKSPNRKEPIVEQQRFEQTFVDDQQSKVLAEIKQLKTMIHSQVKADNRIPEEFLAVYNYLLAEDINKELAAELVEESALLKQKGSPYSIKHLVTEVIENRFANIDTPGISYKKQIIQFVGPTGVGKTTTLAKVAAHSMLHFHKKIVFITTDTYRIAAIDQLKTYARILNVPIEVAYSKSDYHRALEKYKNYDLIFVDTAGRNFRDERYIDELKKIIDTDSMNIETYLVMSLTAKERDVTGIYNRFKQLDIEKVIFTKLDETSTYGNIFNICLPEKKGVAYITNGQDVPDDIVEPDRKYIANLVVSRYEDA